MNITFIDHSGFYVEMEDACFLFDYYKGTIPMLDPDKALTVFVSHKHADHYNGEIFSLIHQCPNVQFILSKGTPVRQYVSSFEEQGIALMEHIRLVAKNMTQDIMLSNGKILKLMTLKSTDDGVAYLLSYEGKTIYHAGDLNLWTWKEEDEQSNRNMRIKYFTQLEKLRGMEIDAAFVPLDSRQDSDADAGLKSFLEVTRSRHVFPMHCWGKYGIISEFRKKYPEYADVVAEITSPGQKFLI